MKNKSPDTHRTSPLPLHVMYAPEAAMEDVFSLNDNSSNMPKTAKAQRRSACDDCRARKVQCSGDLAGCQRCRRAGIRCTYSAPKPPGRPRKIRKIVEGHPAEDAVPLPAAAPAPATAGFYFTDLFGGDFVGQGLEKYVFGIGEHGDSNNNNSNNNNNNAGFEANSSDIFGESPLETPGFGFSGFSPVAPPPPTPKSFSSMSSPSPGFPWATPDDTSLRASSASHCNALSSVPQPCSCLSAFFSAISTLRAPLASNTFSLPPTLTTIRTTLTAITTSMHCRYCHSSVQSTYVCMMMLGTLIPLLLLYIENALSAISTTLGTAAVKLNLGGVEVDLDRSAWRDMASGAVRKEFEVLMRLVDEIEGILQKRHCEGRGKEKEGLDLIAKSGGRCEVGDVVARELVNKNHETGEPPFCIGLLWMIRGMAERVGASSGSLARQ